jgi:hypothetical protein
VDQRSFISSFRAFRRWPKALAFAVLLFAIAEVATGILWRPSVVGEFRYQNYDPAFDYGFGEDSPRLFREGAEYKFYPTEYVNILPFSFPADRPSGQIRIYTLGGSVPRGSGLKPGASYSARLEALLNERHPEHDWRVFNLSADGFGTTRMLNTLMNMVAYGPDALIIHPHGTNEYEDERDAAYRADLYTGVNAMLLRSRMLTLLKKFQQAKLGLSDARILDPDGERIAESDPANTERWMAAMKTNLDRFDCISDALQIPIVYVGRAERDASGFRNERASRLNAPLRDRGHFLEVSTIFSEVAASYTLGELFFDNTHYGEAGHALVAEKLYELLQPGGETAVLDRVDDAGKSRERAVERCRGENGAGPP